jgi:hypothetical protein
LEMNRRMYANFPCKVLNSLRFEGGGMFKMNRRMYANFPCKVLNSLAHHCCRLASLTFPGHLQSFQELNNPAHGAPKSMKI